MSTTTVDLLPRLREECVERLAAVRSEREELERELDDRLAPLREEERRLESAVAALVA